MPDRDAFAERAYQRASFHWSLCIICHSAGGERADVAELCATGRLLTDAWTRAERRAAGIEEELEDPTPPIIY